MRRLRVVVGGLVHFISRRRLVHDLQRKKKRDMKQNRLRKWVFGCPMHTFGSLTSSAKP